MRKSLPVAQKIRLIAQVKAGKSISKLCRQEGISRTILYRWIKAYQVNPQKALLSNRPSGRTHWKKYPVTIENKVRKQALLHPQWTRNQIAKACCVSSFFVSRVLQRCHMNTVVLREAKVAREGTSLIRELAPGERMSLITQSRRGEKVARLCKEAGISRTAFYKWVKQYSLASHLESLQSHRPCGEKHWRFVKGAKELILAIVEEHPQYSANRIVLELQKRTGERILSKFGVHTLLTKLSLNTYEKRLRFAALQKEPSIPVAPADWKLPIFGKIPGISAIPPPSRLFASANLRLFFFLFLSSFLLALLSTTTVSQLVLAVSLREKIGLFFAWFALFCGMFFFAYSLKYYITIALVLSFSRRESEDAMEEVGAKTPFWKKLFMSAGIDIDFSNSQSLLVSHNNIEAKTQRIGLMADLEKIHLLNKPFVSIHLATYNEKRVIDRLLTAATSMLYDNYEVILVDDSTDETREIVNKWEHHEHVKIIHRTSREGFKGGALSHALQVMDPRAEFVMIFDADFIPYPDSITQFLKYFQMMVGDLSFKNVHKNNIAAVQGYQWHVLNKSENWITRGVRTEYAGSYVIERSATELYGGLKQISGSVYMIRADILKQIGWGKSITEDFELTLKIYEQGYKVVYTPYVQAPAEAVSTVKRLIRQRMRWAEGHSFNVRKMFIRLLLGSKVSKEDNSRSFSGKEEWIASPLTMAEKLEFLYLAPYYLQALFFIVGTISWFTAEIVFSVKIPFWTEVWGWSLIITNMLALPLMNMVGLFLEESEEKDYLGIFSFVALSYLVAPFQAYAAVKGFLEKEEGPWFRTPKSGRITDTFIPGRFYRFIWGVFGKQSPTYTPAFSVAANANYYLALTTAHNQFENFHIKPKRMRWIGKSVLTFMIIISLLVSNFVPFQSIGSLKPLVKQPVRLVSNKGITLLSQKNLFAAVEKPQFALNIDKDAIQPDEQKSFGFIPIKNVFASDEKVTTKLYYQSEEVHLGTQIVKTGQGKYAIRLSDDNAFKPGKYTLQTQYIKGSKTLETYQDFSWGVLAINTNKSIYKVGDQVNFSFGVLDDDGRTICHAKIDLKVITPSSKVVWLSSDNKLIQESGFCKNGFSLKADYLAALKVEEEGEYKMDFMAITDKGSKNIADQFKVVNNRLPFDIERVDFPTREYPLREYPVKLNIKVNQDFKGEVVEKVLAKFEIKNISDSGLSKKDKDTQRIYWNVNWKKGETKILAYTIKFPKDSPDFYLVGPLKFVSSIKYQVSSQSTKDKSLNTQYLIPNTENEVFTEARSWQIAADVVTTKFMEAGADATWDTKFWTSSAGTISIDSATVNTGTRSIKAQPAGTADGRLEKDGILAASGNRITTYINFSAAPSATASILQMYDHVATTATWKLSMNTSRVLLLRNDGGTVLTTGTTALSTGTWYRISVGYTITSTTVFTIKVYINGNIEFTSQNSGTLAQTSSTDMLVGFTNAAGTSNFMYIDDVYVDDGTDQTDPGNVHVTAKLPNADTTRGWDTIIGGTGNCVNDSTEYGCVDERTLSESNGVQNTASTSTTFGDSNSASPTAEALSADNKRFSKFTTGSSVDSTVSISAYLDRSGVGTGYAVDAGIYTDNAGAPNSLVANSSINLSTSISKNSAGWYTATYVTAPTLSASTTYWIGVIAAKAIKTHYNSGSTNQQASASDTYSDGFASTFGTPTYANQSMLTYVTYNSTPASETFAIEGAATGDDISGATLVARTAWVWALGSSATTASIYNNGSTTSISLTTSSAMYTDIVDSATYPSNSAAVGMQAISGTPDTSMYETGMMIAFNGGADVPENPYLLLGLVPFLWFGINKLKRKKTV